MEIREFSTQGVVELIPTQHGDARGYFAETFRDQWFRAHVADFGFVQENQSLSSAPGTVRGLHFQSPPFAQGKLVRCIQGTVFDVAVDLRQGSPHFGSWVAVELDAERLNQLWIPPGFAHGFCTLAADCIIAYKVTAYYSRESDHAIAWDDPAIGVEWPAVADPGALSPKDAEAPQLAELPPFFHYQAR